MKNNYYTVKTLFESLNLQEQETIHNLNRVRIHPAEELNHYIIKCIASRVARLKGFAFFTECKVNNKTIDLLVLNPDNEMQTAHEFETVKKKDYLTKSLKQLNHDYIDIKVHYISNLPPSNDEIENYFKKQIV